MGPLFQRDPGSQMGSEPSLGAYLCECLDSPTPTLPLESWMTRERVLFVLVRQK